MRFYYCPNCNNSRAIFSMGTKTTLGSFSCNSCGYIKICTLFEVIEKFKTSVIVNNEFESSRLVNSITQRKDKI